MSSTARAAILAAAAAWALTGAGLVRADVAFTQKPTATRTPDGVTITFAVSEPTDVAVYVEDAAGNVIRHLAAGVLGPNAPAPLKANSLTQTLVWDGKDNTNLDRLSDQADGGGPFRVRVGLGLAAKADGTAFDEHSGPNTLTNVIGLAVGPDGSAYVLSERWRRIWWRSTTVHRFSREGKYLKTIKPFGADLPADRVRAVTALVDDAGRPIPTIYRVLATSFYPKEDYPQQPAVTPDGHMHLVTFRPAYRPGPEKWLATIDADGGIPYPTYAGGELPSETTTGNACLSPSSDGKAVFAIGLERLVAEGYRPNAPAVYRIDLPQRESAVLFLGDPKTTGAGDDRLNDPQGVATDGAGRLFIADRGNNRVLVVNEADGKAVGTLAVPAPTWVGVHRKSGAVYVRSGDAIVKFDGFESGDLLARLDLPAPAPRQTAPNWYFALDAAADPPVLWLGRSRGEPALLRTVDEGTKFSNPTTPNYRPARTFWNLSAGQDGREVACKVGGTTLRILDERTGQWRDMNRLEGSSGQTYRLGPNGQIYGMDHWRWGIRRWDREGKPMPFPATVEHEELKGRLPNRPSGTTAWERDFCVDRAGNIYTKHRGSVYHGRKRVDLYDADGNFKRTVIWVVSDGALGPRVDGAGNVYIAESVLPVGVPYPEFFAGKLPDLLIDSKADPGKQYTWMYGSIIKFSPAGGAVWFPKVDDRFVYAFEGEPDLPADLPKVPVDTSQGDRMAIATGQLQGALWWQFGCSYLLDMQPSHNRRCHCTATEFDLDGFGRVFFPDQGRFRVGVLDANGNVITHVGRYGNQDAAAYVGADPPIAWNTGLTVSDRYLYLADALNRRVARARLVYAAEAGCDVK